MSKHKNLLFYVYIIGLTVITMLLKSSFLAEADSPSNIIYVAGNENFYPIEYYNKESGQFEGIMPAILNDASNSTGIEFVYINGGKSQAEFAKNLQVEVVSAFITDAKEDYIVNSIPVMSFEKNGQIIQIGWGFTTIADEYVINALSKYSEELSEEKLNGFLLSATKNESPKNDNTIAIVIVCVILLIMTVVVLLIKRRSKKELEVQKMTDMDTGIGNLSYFENAFHKVISDENKSLYHIAYIDIDSNYLKLYHGEIIFKDAIRFIAGILNIYADDNCFVARIASNGFAIAFPAVNETETKNVIDTIVGKLNIYIDSYEKSDKIYYRVAVYNLCQTDTNCEILLFNLKHKCMEIKETKEQIVYCDNSVMSSITEEKVLLENILKGFKQNEFKLYVQFVIDNKTKKIVSAEALSRWESADFGIVHPGKYITALEKSGHISSLDYYMFEACCMQLHKWKDTEFDNLSLSCNITRSTLSETDFLDKITDIAQKYIFEKEKLIIEITEEIIEKSFECAIENVKGCKKLGFKIALDDMGTGYTNLINLCDYPIDIVKIDREILLKTDTENGKGLFVGIVALAKSLGMMTVCEGVETEEQKILVETTDCDMVQGWYYSHIFPIREGENFAKEQLQKK